MNNTVQGSDKRPRIRSIRRRIAVLLVIPLVSLVALWGFSASITLGAALDKFHVSTTYDKIGKPGATLAIQLEIERSLSAVVAASHGQVGVADLAAQRPKTDQALAVYQKNAASGTVKDLTSATIKQRMADFAQQLGSIAPTRASVDDMELDPLQVINAYSPIIESSFRLFSGLTIINNLSVYKLGNALILMSYAREYTLREDALIQSLMPQDGDKLSPEEQRAFVGWAASGINDFNQAMPDMTGSVGKPFQDLANSTSYAQLRTAEADIVASKANAKDPSVEFWKAVSGPLLNQWGNATSDAGTALAAQARPIGDKIILQLAIAGGLGLLAVVASIVISLLFVRRISGELRDLQGAAMELAERRLPRIVARLRKGEDVDVAAEAPPLAVGGTAEIVKVAEAFSTVQRTAVDTAVGEAHLRKGISRVFLNLAWRSQSLLHRQLRMLDSMERKASDPQELEDLFRLDHLTTRMRRHAEGLVILSGAPAGRGWNQPVPLDDVLRGAVAEVEDYTRVDVATSSTASLTGSVVADIIHLLAELIENATAFSPPPTEVMVKAETVGNGFAIEVIDRGIGLSPEELAELNLRLARPPEFDLADSDRLGLFVVARLAARHGVKVTLQPSAYGGTTAVVLLPHEMVVGEATVTQARLNAPAAIAGTSSFRGVGRDAGPGVGGAISAIGATSAAAATPDSGPNAWFEPSQIARTPAVEIPPAAPEPDPPLVYEHRTPTGEFGSTDAPLPNRTHTRTRATVPATIPGSLSDGTPEVPGIEEDELPRRIRQTNLVPQLRRDPPPAPKPKLDFLEGDEDDGGRSPEATRDFMTSLQSGWMLGRSDDEEFSGGEDGIPFERRNEWGDS
jgi:signal transduction histidine kinase